jgi:AraC-like DNA-binding protein
LFREKTGMTISEFHEQERIARARLLLTTTDLPVGESWTRIRLGAREDDAARSRHHAYRRAQAWPDLTSSKARSVAY